jgi:hypothetical protein
LSIEFCVPPVVSCVHAELRLGQALLELDQVLAVDRVGQRLTELELLDVRSIQVELQPTVARVDAAIAQVLGVVGLTEMSENSSTFGFSPHQSGLRM